MNVSFQPQAAAHRPGMAPGPQQTPAPAPRASARDAGDTIQLSDAAQRLLSGPPAGKAQSGTPAAQAAAALAGAAADGEAADEAGGARQPFGQVVRGFTPGHLKQAAAAGAQTELAGDATASDPTAVQDDSGVVEEIVGDDGSDVAAAPADAEIADEETLAEETLAEETLAEETPAEAPTPDAAERDLVEAMLDELLEDGDEAVA